MLAVISPAKTLDFSAQSLTDTFTQPDFLADSEELIGGLRKLSPRQLRNLMGISENLAELNCGRYAEFSTPFTTANAKQALLAFKGDVYTGFEIDQFKKRDFDRAQKHLRILSGLYGVLRPLDLIQPYRLEMGTKFKNARGRDLYAFWGDRLTEKLAEALEELPAKSRYLVNLASKEYFSAVQPGGLGAPVINPVFKDEKNGSYKIISFYAKKARGMMSDFLIRERPGKPEDLAAFTGGGYLYDPDGSTDTAPLFLREEGAAAAFSTAA